MYVHMYLLDQFFTSFLFSNYIYNSYGFKTFALLQLNLNSLHFLKFFLLVNFYRYSLKFGEETFSYVLTPPQTFSIKRRRPV